MWPRTSGSMRGENSHVRTRNFVHKCPIRGIVAGSPAAAVLTPTVRSRTENTAAWVSVELLWEGKRNFDELIKTL